MTFHPTPLADLRMDKHFAAFKASNKAILSSLAWEGASAPVLRGTDVFHVYHASIPAGHRFWDLWQVNRAALEERGFRVRSLFPEGWFVELLIPDPEAERRLLDDSAATQSELEVPAPAGLAYYPFQRAGIEFLETHPQALLADDPGCGKGIQITGLLNLRPEIRSVLVICPACMKLTWRQELEKWLVNGQCVALADDSGFERADIWIINYEQLAKYHAQLRGRRLDLLIADESHYLKNPKSQRSKLVRALGPLARRRILLTGTPVLNKPAELWAQLNLIDPMQWPKFFPFALRYCNAHRNQFGWDFSGSSNLQELKLRLRASCMLRRRKLDVLPQLPEITRAMVPLGGCVSTDGQLDEVTSQIATEMKMSVEELASSRCDIDPEDISFSYAARARAILGTMKLGPALEFIREESEGDPESKFVIFAHHLQVLHGLAQGLPGALLVTGETPLHERQRAIDRFQTDPAAKYFVASIMAMSLGVTLTAASRVVFVETSWVPAILEQAESRCLRIGQRNAVLAQYLTVPDSIDTAIMRTVAAKLEVISAVVEKNLNP